jgi:hypothetical protein
MALAARYLPFTYNFKAAARFLEILWISLLAIGEAEHFYQI